MFSINGTEYKYPEFADNVEYIQTYVQRNNLKNVDLLVEDDTLVGYRKLTLTFILFTDDDLHTLYVAYLGKTVTIVWDDITYTCILLGPFDATQNADTCDWSITLMFETIGIVVA